MGGSATPESNGKMTMMDSADVLKMKHGGAGLGVLAGRSRNNLKTEMMRRPQGMGEQGMSLSMRRM